MTREKPGVGNFLRGCNPDESKISYINRDKREVITTEPLKITEVAAGLRLLRRLNSPFQLAIICTKLKANSSRFNNEECKTNGTSLNQRHFLHLRRIDSKKKVGMRDGLDRERREETEETDKDDTPRYQLIFQTKLFKFLQWDIEKTLPVGRHHRHRTG
ncbi:hypothetical protein RUM43_008733 [Polyplax serrata]|uniref:Uncharacterized protein n=1 Tax=Polyplax serrata TaxID=468196 RepID=A0AAN8PAB0_POLSC